MAKKRETRVARTENLPREANQLVNFTPNLPLEVLDNVVDGFLQFLADAASIAAKKQLTIPDIKEKLGIAINVTPIIRAGVYRGKDFQEIPPKGHPMREKMPKVLPGNTLPDDLLIELEIATHAEQKAAIVDFADALGENAKVTKTTRVRLDDNFKAPGRPTICIQGVTSILNASNYLQKRKIQQDREQSNVPPVIGINEDITIDVDAAPATETVRALKTGEATQLAETALREGAKPGSHMEKAQDKKVINMRGVN